MSSDKEEFCRLDRLLISIAVEGGNQPGPEQVCIQQVISAVNCSTSSTPVQGCFVGWHVHVACPFNAYHIAYTSTLHFLPNVCCGHVYLTPLACLPACLLVGLPACLPVPMSVSVCVCLCLSVCLFVCMPACLYICLSVCLLVCLSVWLCRHSAVHEAVSAERGNTSGGAGVHG